MDKLESIKTVVDASSNRYIDTLLDFGKQLQANPGKRFQFPEALKIPCTLLNIKTTTWMGGVETNEEELQKLITRIQQTTVMLVEAINKDNDSLQRIEQMVCYNSDELRHSLDQSINFWIATIDQISNDERKVGAIVSTVKEIATLSSIRCLDLWVHGNMGKLNDKSMYPIVAVSTTLSDTKPTDDPQVAVDKVAHLLVKKFLGGELHATECHVDINKTFNGVSDVTIRLCGDGGECRLRSTGELTIPTKASCMEYTMQDVSNHCLGVICACQVFERAKQNNEFTTSSDDKSKQQEKQHKKKLRKLAKKFGVSKERALTTKPAEQLFTMIRNVHKKSDTTPDEIKVSELDPKTRKRTIKSVRWAQGMFAWYIYRAFFANN